MYTNQSGIDVSKVVNEMFLGKEVLRHELCHA